MEDLIVTKFWMAGVMGMMLVYGSIALFGYFRKKRKSNRE